MFSFFDFEAICFDTNNAHEPSESSVGKTHYEKGIEYAKKLRLNETVLGLGDEGDGQAIITSGSHPDFVAGCFAGARGKKVRLIKTSHAGEPARIGVNHYAIDGSNKPLLISYPCAPSVKKNEHISFLKSLGEKSYHLDTKRITFYPQQSLIISSQTPQRKEAFPQEGGTALALHTITGLPVIKMHKDSQARAHEKPVFERIGNGSTVYITGHGSLGSDGLSGLYINPHTNAKQKWSLENFRDLILANSQLQENDSLTIVLWACESGGGGVDSVAAKLALLFQEKGINTRIIASTVEMLRFDGKPEPHEILTTEGASAFNPDDHYIPQGRLRFRTAKPDTVRVFDCNKEGLFESKNKGPVYFTAQGMTGIQATETAKLLSKAILEIQCSPYFRKDLTDRTKADKAVKDLFEKDKSTSPFVLRPASRHMPGYFSFVLTYFDKEKKHISNILYRIDQKGNLYNAAESDKVGSLIECNGLSPLNKIMALNQDLFKGSANSTKQEVDEGLISKPELNPLPPSQSPSPLKAYDETPLHQKIQKAVNQASACYLSYHTQGVNDRNLRRGLFSFFRHGQQGQVNARELSTSISKKTSTGEILTLLRNTAHLRFHNHSFGSYLKDEIDRILNLAPDSANSWDVTMDKLSSLAPKP
ncbi:hypothetical protein DIZ81_06220 [Legionella taurinensis]|uniref:Peptidase C80 domain-containing protein n=1 Tax=Legionella taurinensis TaxID=70611 RepID=A0A3A5LAC5_9GAMM|nr:hypothetical protein [Legionella taurinensis]MDX1837514.1 hypothetical protein [Legionella taurinensis]PUT40853.1 hypothetical protein DB744_06220 [Legionella taurinensis]PUT44274.1 hypothetical protein DB746_04620 [Legionella taurinensis]PUT47576.1 hypothetical protein DB743_02790 [Legionella taurinensis]PUT48715.1 hypothetical protein DB745_04620 [Legionella taurinensis]